VTTTERDRPNPRDRRVARLAALVAAVAFTGAGCVDDVAGSSDRVSGSVSDRFDDVVSVASGRVRDAVEILDARADCLAEGAVDTFGEDEVEDYDVGGDPMELADQAGADVGEVSDAVEHCLDLKPFLVDVLAGAGASDADAACIADFILDNDRLREPILLQLLLGDPGVLTAIGLAARGADSCDLGPDVALDLPGW
jgi:hypothetical protein